MGISLLVTIAATWLAAVRDHPIDEAIVAGMASPQCEATSRIPAGSVLSATLPDSDVCRSYFLYRATQPYAVADAHSYMGLVMQARVAEFWKLLAAILILWAFAIALVVSGGLLVRKFFTRH